ncbi:MAG: hypothetical protein PHT38_02430 [Halothiobacillus sp.]|jgi:hypothetical protein|nr:hypothetical protein [Halothiobacillus sp.]
MDMQEGIMEKMTYGQAALKKLAPVPEGFRLYEAGWIDENPQKRTVMQVTGAVFREAKTGPNKGKMTVKVDGTKQTVYVTADEMREFEHLSAG